MPKLVALALLLACLPIHAQTKSAKETIASLEHQYDVAVQTGDAALMGRLLSDDFTNVEPNGHVSGKAEQLAQLKQKAPEDYGSSDLKIRVYADAAVVVGKVHFTTTKDGAKRAREITFTDVWILRSGNWQCVASHDTLAE